MTHPACRYCTEAEKLGVTPLDHGRTAHPQVIAAWHHSLPVPDWVPAGALVWRIGEQVLLGFSDGEEIK